MCRKKLLCFTGHRIFKVAWLFSWDYTKLATCGVIGYKYADSFKNFEFRYEALFTL